MGLFDRKKKAKDLITPLPPPGVHDPPYLGPPPAAPPSVAGTHYGPVRSAQSFVPVSTSRPKSRQLAPSRPSVDVGPGQQQSWAVPSVDQLQSQQRRTTGPTAQVDPTGGPRDDARRRDGNTGRSSAADERVSSVPPSNGGSADDWLSSSAPTLTANPLSVGQNLQPAESYGQPAYGGASQGTLSSGAPPQDSNLQHLQQPSPASAQSRRGPTTSSTTPFGTSPPDRTRHSSLSTVPAASDGPIAASSGGLASGKRAGGTNGDDQSPSSHPRQQRGLYGPPQQYTQASGPASQSVPRRELLPLNTSGPTGNNPFAASMAGPSPPSSESVHSHHASFQQPQSTHRVGIAQHSSPVAVQSLPSTLAGGASTAEASSALLLLSATSPLEALSSGCVSGLHANGNGTSRDPPLPPSLPSVAPPSLSSLAGGQASYGAAPMLHRPSHHSSGGLHGGPHSASQSSISTIGTQPSASERSHLSTSLIGHGAGPGLNGVDGGSLGRPPPMLHGRQRSDSAPLATIPSANSVPSFNGNAGSGGTSSMQKQPDDSQLQQSYGSPPHPPLPPPPPPLFQSAPLASPRKPQVASRATPTYAPPPGPPPTLRQPEHAAFPQQQQQAFPQPAYPQPMLRYPSPQPFQALEVSDYGGGTGGQTDPASSQPLQPPQPGIFVSTAPVVRDGGAGVKDGGSGGHWRAAGGKSRKLGAFLSSLSSGVGKERPSEDGGRPSFDGLSDGVGYQHYQVESHRPSPATTQGEGPDSGGDDVEGLVSMLCALPPFVLQSESERTVFITTVQDIKWRLANPTAVAADTPASADEEKLAERVGRRIRKELKDLPSDVKKAEKEREKGEAGAADGGRRLGGGIAGVWWWLMLWGEDATVLRICSTPKFTGLVETAIRKLPPRAEQRKELYHVLADLADRFRGHEGSEDLEKSFVRVWEAEKGLGIVQEPPPSYISEYREGRTARLGPRQTPYPLPSHQQQQQQPLMPQPPHIGLVAPTAEPSVEIYHQRQQSGFVQPTLPIQSYDHIPTGFQVQTLPSVQDDLLRLEEECQGAIRAAKRLRGTAEEVGGLQRMGVDVDDETMSSFKASYDACVRIQGELVNHLPWAESTAGQSLVKPSAPPSANDNSSLADGQPGSDDTETKAQDVLRLLVDATSKVAEAIDGVHELEREKQEAEELALVSERSRKETRHDRSQPVDAHLGVPRIGSSRSPSPAPRPLWDEAPSHRSNAGAGGQSLGPVGGLSGGHSPSAQSVNLRSPAMPDDQPLQTASSPRGPNDPTRPVTSPVPRPLPIPGGGSGQATPTFLFAGASAPENSDTEPSAALLQPSAKALGKRRVIEALEPDVAFDPDDIYKTADDRTPQRQASLPHSDADPELQEGWVPPKPVHYIYDAAEEHKKVREEERVREALRAYRLANGLGSSAFASEAGLDNSSVPPSPPPPPPPPPPPAPPEVLPPSKRLPQGLAQEKEVARLLGAAAGSRTPPLGNSDDKEGAGAALGRKLSFWKKGSHIPGHRSASREH